MPTKIPTAAEISRLINRVQRVMTALDEHRDSDFSDEIEIIADVAQALEQLAPPEPIPVPTNEGWWWWSESTTLVYVRIHDIQWIQINGRVAVRQRDLPGKFIGPIVNPFKEAK